MIDQEQCKSLSLIQADKYPSSRSHPGLATTKVTISITSSILFPHKPSRSPFLLSLRQRQANVAIHRNLLQRTRQIKCSSLVLHSSSNLSIALRSSSLNSSRSEFKLQTFFKLFTVDCDNRLILPFFSSPPLLLPLLPLLLACCC
jgi:hypothetical protein